MQTEPPDRSTPAQTPHSAQLERMEHAIEELNARIARLAIALGVSLDDDDHIASVLHAPEPKSVPVERRAEPRGHGRPWGGHDRRMAYARQELRGLIVMRYDMEKTFVDQVGASTTRQIMIDVEAHMSRDGFKPGADGVNLDSMLPS